MAWPPRNIFFPLCYFVLEDSHFTPPIEHTFIIEPLHKNIY